MADTNDPNRKKLPGAKDQGDGKESDGEKESPALKSNADDDSNDGWGRKRGGGGRVFRTKGTWKFARRTLMGSIPASILMDAEEYTKLPDKQLYQIDRSGEAIDGSAEADIDSTAGAPGEEGEGKQAVGGKDRDSKKGDPKKGD